MKKLHDQSESVAESFRNDMSLLKDLLGTGGERSIVSYGIYIAIGDTKSKDVNHFSSFASDNNVDVLLGRIEMLKSIVLNYYNKQQDLDLLVQSGNETEIKGKTFRLEDYIDKPDKDKLN